MHREIAWPLKPEAILRVCLFGQPFWAGRLAETLRRYSANDVEVCTFFPQRGRAAGSWKDALRADIAIRVGYRPGAPTPFGVLYELFWKCFRRCNPKAMVAYYWIGTDVLKALTDVRGGTIRGRLFEAAKEDIHFVDAPWLKDELREIGIRAIQQYFPSPILKAEELPPMPSRFSVLTYIPERRFRFYGGEAIHAVARRMPEIQFDVVAGTGKWVKSPLPNLHFHGWQKDLRPFYRASSVVLRLVEHDALGASVQEGLCFGRYVIYSYPFPHCIHVRSNDEEALAGHLRHLYDLNQQGQLEPNREGWLYGLREFDEARYSRRLVSYLKELASPGLREEVGA